MAKKEKKQGRVGTIIGIVLCLLLVPILVINVTIIIKGLVNPGKVPSVGGYSPLIVLTDSMYPDIKSGDLIFVKQIDAKDVKVDDVIAFFDPDLAALDLRDGDAAEAGQVAQISLGEAQQLADLGQVLRQFFAHCALFGTGKFDHNTSSVPYSQIIR